MEIIWEYMTLIYRGFSSMKHGKDGSLVHLVNFSSR